MLVSRNYARRLASSRSKRQPFNRPGVDRAERSKSATSAWICWLPGQLFQIVPYRLIQALAHGLGGLSSLLCNSRVD
jgi:hypothetical protein